MVIFNIFKKKVDKVPVIKNKMFKPLPHPLKIHGCAHNPTGLDPTENQWKQIAEIMKVKKKLL